MPALRKFHVLEQEQFDRLLAWLHQDREQAGLIYEKIRSRLITIFAARSCLVPEELADETIDRVARRIGDVADTYSGDQALYFFGVANNVHHEYLKRPALPEHDVPLGEHYPQADPDKERMHHCLERCLDRLPGETRELVVRYYSLEKQSKIELRKQMADELGVSINTLRLRVLRWKEKLQPCVERCLDRTEI